MQRGADASPFPKHFDGRRFFNPGPRDTRGFLDLLRWKLTSRAELSPRFLPDVTPSKPPSAVEGDELRITLINHSTVLLQRRSWHILTDPIWSERTSPFSWIGPRRRRAPGVEWRDLPRIDTVLLSHNHYDHLDLFTLRRLADRGESQFVVPKGVAALLRSQGIGSPHELDWGESVCLGGITIHAVPAKHFSARGLFDRDRTLWCGYMIEDGPRLLYFAGDTGFGDHFAQIRQRFDAPDVALLPIGAFEPRWFMHPVHMGPQEAVQAHRILGARTSIAIHYGTFQLGDEAVDTPARMLRECVPGDSFLALRNGESVTLS